MIRQSDSVILNSGLQKKREMFLLLATYAVSSLFRLPLPFPLRMGLLVLCCGGRLLWCISAARLARPLRQLLFCGVWAGLFATHLGLVATGAVEFGTLEQASSWLLVDHLTFCLAFAPRKDRAAQARRVYASSLLAFASVVSFFVPTGLEAESPGAIFLILMWFSPWGDLLEPLKKHGKREEFLTRAIHHRALYLLLLFIMLLRLALWQEFIGMGTYVVLGTYAGLAASWAVFLSLFYFMVLPLVRNWQ